MPTVARSRSAPSSPSAATVGRGNSIATPGPRGSIFDEDDSSGPERAEETNNNNVEEEEEKLKENTEKWIRENPPAIGVSSGSKGPQKQKSTHKLKDQAEKRGSISLVSTEAELLDDARQKRNQIKPEDCTIHPPASMPPPASPTKLDDQIAESHRGLKKGAFVRVDGLRREEHQHHNGKTGALFEFDTSVGRWNVGLRDGTGIKVRPENLTLVDASLEKKPNWVGSRIEEEMKEMIQNTADQQIMLVQEAIKEGTEYTSKLVRQKLVSFYESKMNFLKIKKRTQHVGHHVKAPRFEHGGLEPDFKSSNLEKHGDKNGLVSPNANNQLALPARRFVVGNGEEDSGKSDNFEDRSPVPSETEKEEKEKKDAKVMQAAGKSGKHLGVGRKTQRPVLWSGTADLEEYGDDDNASQHSRRSTVNNTRKSMCLSIEEKQRLETDRWDDMGKPSPIDKGVFVDVTAMKHKVREAINKEPYRVENFYKHKGPSQRIARSSFFDQCTLFIIGFNAIWISIETDYNKADVLVDAESHFVIMENFFCVYFVLEWVIRFTAFGKKRHCMRDMWFVFDSVLVFFMILETWVMTLIIIVWMEGSSVGLSDASILRLFRLLRLTRMARMARLLRAMPELMILIKAIFVAFRSVFFTLCLLAIMIYVFAIAFVQLTRETCVGSKYFPKVPHAMMSLLMMGNLPDFSIMAYEVAGTDHPDTNDCTPDGTWYNGIILMVFFFLAPITVLGMLAGVLVEVVSTVSAVEKEESTVNFVTQQLKRILQDVDRDNNGKISQMEFRQLVIRPDAARMMASVGVDVIGLADFCDFLFTDSETIAFSVFMELVLQLRGTNTATVKDIVDMRKFMRQELADVVVNELAEVYERIDALTQLVKDNVSSPGDRFAATANKLMRSGSSLKEGRMSKQRSESRWQRLRENKPQIAIFHAEERS